MPHRKSHVLADVHQGGRRRSTRAIDAAGDAWEDWSRIAWEERAAIFLRAAELLSGPWRATLNAATMLGQSKTAHQAEIDAACELIDFYRFNVEFMTRIYEEQPISSTGRLEPDGVPAARGLRLRGHAVQLHRDRRQPARERRPDGQHGRLEAGRNGVLLGALPDAAAAVEAGLPPGVINLVYGPGATIGDAALASPHLAGVHFTGSTGVFNSMWKTIGSNVGDYRNYPRIVGETGGKDFIVAHPSADVGRGRDGDRARLVRVPGAEVLGRVARLRAVEPLAGAARAARRAGRRSSRWATSPTSRTSWAPSSTQSSFTTQKEAIEEARAHEQTRGRRRRRRQRRRRAASSSRP